MYVIIKGSLEVKLPTIWRAEKQRREERVEKKSRREKEKESEERRYTRAKCEESRQTLCFPMICGSGGSKSRLAKAAGAET